MLAVDQSPLLCSMLCKRTTERWAFTGLGSPNARAMERCRLKSHSLGTALGDVTAECQGKGFAAVLALGNMPGVRRARGAIPTRATGLSSLLSLPSNDQKQMPRS